MNVQVSSLVTEPLKASARLAIADWYRRRYGVELDPDSEAIVTIGSKEGIAHLALAILDQGDVVLAPTRSTLSPTWLPL